MVSCFANNSLDKQLELSNRNTFLIQYFLQRNLDSQLKRECIPYNVQKPLYNHLLVKKSNK